MLKKNGSDNDCIFITLKEKAVATQRFHHLKTGESNLRTDQNAKLCIQLGGNFNGLQ